MFLSNYEKEATINFNAAEDFAEVFTADPVYMRKLDKLCQEHPKDFIHVEDSKVYGEIVGKMYRIPKKAVRFRPKRELTEEQKENARQRGLALFAKRTQNQI